MLPQFCSFGFSSFFWFKYFSCSFSIACYSSENTASLEAWCETLELVYGDGDWQAGIQKWDQLKLCLSAPLRRLQLLLPGRVGLRWTLQLPRRYCHLHNHRWLHIYTALYGAIYPLPPSPTCICSLLQLTRNKSVSSLNVSVYLHPSHHADTLGYYWRWCLTNPELQTSITSAPSLLLKVET